MVSLTGANEDGQQEQRHRARQAPSTPTRLPAPAFKQDVSPISVTALPGGSKYANAVPRIVVIGTTGAGKSTTLNRLMTPLTGKRAKHFKEGAGAASETDMPNEVTAAFFGDEAFPARFVDMPGLDDSRGAREDTRHIRDAATFLMDREDPEAHLFVLVVNSQSPRMSGSVRNMMTTFKKVFDADHTQRFVDYLAIVFTRVPFIEMMYEDGDTDTDPVTPEDFTAALGAQIETLAAEWATGLADLLGYKGDKAVAQRLKNRCVFSDHKMPAGRVRKLRDLYHFDVANNLQQLYLMAYRNVSNPFKLRNIDNTVAAREDELEQQAKEAAKAEADAKQQALEAEEAAAKREREIREKAEAKAQQLREEHAAKLAKERAKQEKLIAKAKEQERARQEAEKLRRAAEKRRKDEEERRKAAEQEAAKARQREADAEASRMRQQYTSRMRQQYMQLMNMNMGRGYGRGGTEDCGGCRHARRRRWGNQYGRGSKCLDCGAECG